MGKEAIRCCQLDCIHNILVRLQPNTANDDMKRRNEVKRILVLASMVSRRDSVLDASAARYGRAHL
jgi:hypothetical protein